jgi:probable phosphoglycerate mutase
MAMWLVRHGETEWSISGQHTGSTDLALTPEGQLQAVAIGKLLAGRRFDHVFASPMLRARETGGLAGFGDRIRVYEGLLEVDYGEFEGLTTQQIQEIHPGWELFRDGCLGGETPEQMAKRVDGVIDELRELGGNILLFGHATASVRSPPASSTCRSGSLRTCGWTPGRSRSSRTNGTLRRSCCGTDVSSLARWSWPTWPPRSLARSRS